MTQETEAEVVDSSETEAPHQETAKTEEKSNLQKRFDTITREKYEAMQERDLLRKQAEELQAKLDAQPEKPEPTLESLDYDDEAYQEALISQKAEAAARKIIEETQQAQTATQQNAQAMERAKAFAVKEAEFATQIADYDQVAKNPMLPISDAMADIIQTSDKGPALAYHLGKHPDQAYAIAQMDTVSAQRELIRIEMGFEAPKQVSNAPDPVPDIGGLDSPDVGLSDNLSTEEWIKRRNKQVHG